MKTLIDFFENLSPLSGWVNAIILAVIVEIIVYIIIQISRRTFKGASGYLGRKSKEYYERRERTIANLLENPEYFRTWFPLFSVLNLMNTGIAIIIGMVLVILILQLTASFETDPQWIQRRQLIAMVVGVLSTIPVAFFMARQLERNSISDEVEKRMRQEKSIWAQPGTTSDRIWSAWAGEDPKED